MVVSLIGAPEKDSVDFKSVILVFGERNGIQKRTNLSSGWIHRPLECVDVFLVQVKFHFDN